MDTAFMFYMMEAEGMDECIGTKEAKINAAINDFKKLKNKGIDPNSQIIQVLADHGLDESDLSDSECRRIVRAVNGY